MPSLRNEDSSGRRGELRKYGKGGRPNADQQTAGRFDWRQDANLGVAPGRVHSGQLAMMVVRDGVHLRGARIRDAA